MKLKIQMSLRAKIADFMFGMNMKILMLFWIMASAVVIRQSDLMSQNQDSPP